MSQTAIKQLQETWRATAKDEVHPVELQGSTGHQLLTELMELKVFLTLVVTDKGVVQEYLQVLDSGVTPEGALIVSFTTKRGGMLISLSDIHTDINSGVSAEAACRSQLEEVLAVAKRNPRSLFEEIMEIRNGGRGSLRTVSGGLPSLGKRHS